MVLVVAVLLKAQELTLEELEQQIKVMQEEQDIVQVMRVSEVEAVVALVPLVLMVDLHLVRAQKEMVV